MGPSSQAALLPHLGRLSGLFDILDEFTHFFERRFDLHNVSGHFHIVCFGANGVRFPAHFLNDKLEFPAGSIRFCTHDSFELFEVTVEPNDFFRDVPSFSPNRDFSYQVDRIHCRAGVRQQSADPL